MSSLETASRNSGSVPPLSGFSGITGDGTGAPSATTNASAGHVSHQRSDVRRRKWEWRKFDSSRDPRGYYPLQWGFVDGPSFRRVEIPLGLHNPCRAELVQLAEAKLHNTLPGQRQTFSPEDQERILESLYVMKHKGWVWQAIKQKFGDSWPTDDEYDALHRAMKAYYAEETRLRKDQAK
jgi:hypothetical protein